MIEKFSTFYREQNGMENTVLRYQSGRISAQLERTQKVLVTDVSFTIAEGKSLSLIGETGSGKTMIAQSIMRLLPSNVDTKDGNAFFMGKQLPSKKVMQKLLGAEIVYIPQNGLEFLDPSRTIRKQLYDSLKKLGTAPSAMERTAIEKLQCSGLNNPEGVLDKYSFQLSGGMAQRVVIALAACSHAKLVIADEPTNGLDYEARFHFQKLLGELFPNAAKLIITHDITVAEFCDMTLVLCQGKMMERGPSGSVLANPRHPYTRALLASLVKNGMRESPVLRQEAGACPYYRRCPQATEICRSTRACRREGDIEWWCNDEP